MIGPRRLGSRGEAAAAVLLAAMLWAPAAGAALLVTPGEATVFPTETTPPVTVTLSFINVPPNPGTFELRVDLPPSLLNNAVVVPSPVTYTIGLGDFGATAHFQIATSAGTPPGAHPVTIEDDLFGSGRAMFFLRVRAPSFSAAVRPEVVALTVGGGPETVEVVTRADPGLSGPISYSFAGLPAFVLTGGSRVVEGPVFPPVTFAVGLRRGAVPGTYRGRLKGVSAAGTVELPFTVRVAAAPGFVARVSPNPLTLTLGEGPISAVVTTVADPGFEGPISYSFAGLPPFLVTGGTRVVEGPAYPPTVFAVSLGAGAVAGRYDGVLRGIGGPIRARQTEEVPFSVVVRPAVPVIREILPPSLAAGSHGVTVRLIGRNFEPGSVVRPESPLLRAAGARTISTALVEVSLSVRSDAPPGSYRLDLTLPNGATTREGGRIRVIPSASLAAPFGVTAAAVVFPRPGAQIGEGEALRPRGLLAASGTGTVLGSWRLDGVAFDRFAVSVVAGEAVEVTSQVPIPRSFRGRHRLELVVEHPQRLASPQIPLLLTTRASSRLRLLGPADGAVVAGERPAFRWSLVPGVSGYELEIERPAPEPALSLRIAEAEWSPGDWWWAEIGSGARRWRVRPVFAGETRGEATPWRRLTVLPETMKTAMKPTVKGARRGPPPAGPSCLASVSRDSTGSVALASWPPTDPLLAGLAQQGVEVDETGGLEEEAGRSQWLASLEGSVTGFAGDAAGEADQAGISLSFQEDFTRGVGWLKSTSDLALRRLLEGEGGTLKDNESWLVETGLTHRSFGTEIRGGYGSPRFLDGAELLSAGFAQGGIEGILGGRVLSASYFETFDPELGIVSAGSFGGDQKLRAGALTVGGDERRYRVRVVGLEADEEGAEFAPGGRGSALGLLVRAAPIPGHELVLEVARGDFDPNPGSFEAQRDGSAFHLGLAGARGSWSYGLDLRRVDAGFSNPADRGLTPGGLPDRDSAELFVSRRFQRGGDATLRLRHLDGGDSFGPPARVEAASLSLSRPLSQRVFLSACGDFVTTQADGDEGSFLPRLERRDWGGRLVVTESLGGFQLAQSLSMQRSEDEVNPAASSTTTAVSLSGGGQLVQRFSLSLAVDAQRFDSDPRLGRTETLSLSLQPVLDLPRVWLQVAPYLAYSESRNEVLDFDAASEAYQLRLSVNPPWGRSLLSFEITGDWTRSRDATIPGPHRFDRRIVLVLTLRGSGRGAPGAAPAPIALSRGPCAPRPASRPPPDRPGW